MAMHSQKNDNLHKYRDFKLSQLRDELRKRKAKVAGRKGELIERLEAYDRNFNFGNSCDNENEYLMDVPPAHLFVDLNSSSQFKMAHHNSYSDESLRDGTPNHNFSSDDDDSDLDNREEMIGNNSVMSETSTKDLKNHVERRRNLSSPYSASSSTISTPSKSPSPSFIADDSLVEIKKRTKFTENETVGNLARNDKFSPQPCTIRNSSGSLLKSVKYSNVKQNPGSQNSAWYLQHWICGLVLILVLFTTFFFLKNNAKLETDGMVNSTEILKDFEKSFLSLRETFPTQSRHLWLVIKARTKSIITNVDPIEPAVIMLIVPKDVHRTGQCLVQKYSEAVTQAFQANPAIQFFSSLHTDSTPAHVKHLIDDQLRSGFLSGSRVAVIHELDKLRAESVMMFHGFCDNENAPFRRVVIIFTLYVDELAGQLTDEEDKFVEKRLSELWSDELGIDKFIPLLSRIGNSIAFTKKESDIILNNIGC